MNPEHYANEYRRYQTFVKNLDEDKDQIQKVCCGANVDDYYWTKDVMKTCFAHVEKKKHGNMDYLSLHYYVHPEGWEIKGSAIEKNRNVCGRVGNVVYL